MRCLLIISFLLSGLYSSAQSADWAMTDSIGRLIVQINDSQEKKFTFKIYDAEAEEVFTEELRNVSSPYSRKYNLDELPRGIYFVALQPETGRRQFKRIMLQ